MTPVAARQVLLARWAGQRRHRRHRHRRPRTARTARPGRHMFVNTLVLRARVRPDLPPSGSCPARCAPLVLEAFAHQEVPF
ncbi:hypothetical protein LT493_15580 [Streptomyces tricolor]|nr:hypothetical protein [Streptomyces tricolor]